MFCGFSNQFKKQDYFQLFLGGAHLIDIELCTIPRYLPVVKGELNSISQMQFAVANHPQLHTVGCNNDFLKALDQDPDRQAGVQYPVCLYPIDIRKLTYETKYNKLGGIDMFSSLETLL